MIENGNEKKKKCQGFGSYKHSNTETSGKTPVGGHTHCVCKQLANAPPKTFLTNGFIIKSPNHPIPPPSPQVAIHSTKIVYSDPDLTTENMTRLGNTPHNQTALDRISLDSEWR